MATSNMHKKIGEDQTCSSGDMIADKHTHRQTNKHAHHNAPIGIFWSIFAPPLLGWSKNANILTKHRRSFK